MSEITIRNKEFLAKLDSFVEKMYAEGSPNEPRYHTFHEEDAASKGEIYTSDDFFFEHCLPLETPIDAPIHYFAQPISKMVRENPERWSEYMEEVKYNFASDIGAHTSALLSYYPPGGYVGWHTNWKANAYQVLFTWSENGDGYFKYYDLETKKIVKIQDKPGWQARHYYFGALDEPQCWHAAYNGTGDRITLAYKFVNGGSVNNPEDKFARLMRDLLIEDIESE